MTFKDIELAIINDKSNALYTPLGYLPIYTADTRARIMIVGQAPGKKAQESGIPWNDSSGRTLIDWLGITEEQFRDPKLFALIPMDFYYPGKGAHGDLPPRKDFAPKWHPQLLTLMPDIKLTLLIGNYAQKYYLQKKAKQNLTQTVRAFEEYTPNVMPLVHPSPLNFRWHTKNPWFKTELLPILKSRVSEIIHPC